MSGMNCEKRPCSRKGKRNFFLYVILPFMLLAFPLMIPAQAYHMSSEDLPGTLDTSSKVKWVSVYIELSHDMSVNEVLPHSVNISHINGEALRSPVYAEGPSGIGDYDKDGIPNLMIKFDRKKLARLLDAGQMQLTLSGKMRSGKLFSGLSTLTVTGK